MLGACLVEGDDVAVVADLRAGVGCGEAVAGDHDPEVVAMSRWPSPRRSVTVASAIASFGGIESGLPRQAISARRDAVLVCAPAVRVGRWWRRVRELPLLVLISQS